MSDELSSGTIRRKPEIILIKKKSSVGLYLSGRLKHINQFRGAYIDVIVAVFIVCIRIVIDVGATKINETAAAASLPVIDISRIFTSSRRCFALLLGNHCLLCRIINNHTKCPSSAARLNLLRSMSTWGVAA